MPFYRQWQFAIADFTQLLKQDPSDARARTFRGRALAKMGHFVQAVADLSAAIHLDPNASSAYYHRGCLLRRAQPERALQVSFLALPTSI